MGRIIRFYVIRPNDAVEVWLMNNKGFAAGCHFVNVTKGHICPCEFDNFESAIEDLNKQIKEGRVVSYARLPDMLSEPLENKEAKEAEKYQIRKHHQRLYGNKPVVMKELNITYKDGFKDGCNKAKEWQYVKEGCKYPENGESVLVTVLDDDNEKIVTMALFELENNKRFWDIESRLCSVHSGSEEVCSKIIAWARVLPAGGEK